MHSVHHLWKQNLKVNILQIIIRQIKKEVTAKKINKIHQKNIEEKLMFGGVLEKKTDKIRRLKNQSKSLERFKSVGADAPDSEQYWLANLNVKTVKLFRRTESGKYVEVDKGKVLEKFAGAENSVSPVDTSSQSLNNLGSTKKKPGRKNKKECVDKDSIKQIKPKKLSTKAKKKEAVDLEHLTLSSRKTEEISVQPAAVAVDENNVTNSSLLNSNNLLPDVMVLNITSYPLFKSSSVESSISVESNNLSSDVLAPNIVLRLPSVSKILSTTMSASAKAALERWKTNLIAELGEEEFNKYSQALLANGRDFHSLIRHTLDGTADTQVPTDGPLAGCYQSVAPILQNVQQVYFLESGLVHPVLMYKGVVDCVAKYLDKPCVIEWKKSDKPKPHISSTYDAPLQTCAYLGALQHDSRYQQLNVKQGLVVVAYTDGSPADVYHIEPDQCYRYWNSWLERLQNYWFMHNQIRR